MANIYDLLPTFNYIEVNNLKGIQPGFVVAQMEVVKTDAKQALLKDKKGNAWTEGDNVANFTFFENGKICAISNEGIIAATGSEKALFIHYTEPLNTVANSDKYFAVDTTEECPRLVQLIPGDEWMSTDPNCEIAGRIVKVNNDNITEGWYSVKTMANGDAGYHYMFLG